MCCGQLTSMLAEGAALDQAGGQPDSWRQFDRLAHPLDLRDRILRCQNLIQMADHPAHALKLSLALIAFGEELFRDKLTNVCSLRTRSGSMLRPLASLRAPDAPGPSR